MHCPDWDESILSALDADRIVSQVAATGCKGMVVFAKDTYGNAYYNTGVGHKHACIGDRDLLAEFLEAGKRRGVMMAAYFCAIWDNRACEMHPEWRLLGPDGKPACDTVTNNGVARWQSVCPNSGFADQAETMIEELASAYPVDGFHLDMFNLDFGGLSCYCDTCQRLFFEETGRDLPRTPLWDETWRLFLEFRYRSVERYMQRLREAARRHRADIPVLLNYHGAPGFDWRPGQQPLRHTLPSDIGTVETYTPMLGTLYPGMATRFVRSLVPDRPMEVVSWRMNRVTDFTTKPLQQLRWELFTSMCWGANCMLIDQPFHDGQLDPHPYRLLKDIFDEAERKRPYFGGTPQNHVAIYYSCKSRDLYGRDEQARFLQPVMGLYKALVENHFDIGFVFDESLTLDALCKYPVLALPNTAALSEDEARIITEYVRQGGTLIASYDSSLYDELGERLSDFRLAEVLGLHYAGTLDCDAAYLRNFPPPHGQGIDADCYLLTLGLAHRVTPTTARGFGDLHDSFHRCLIPEQFFSHSMHPPYTRVMSGLYENAFGKGKAIYFPCAVDAAYAGEHELPGHRMLLANAVRRAGFVPDVQVDAPLNVESAVFRKAGNVLVHLMGFNALHQSTTLPSLNQPIRPSIRMEEAPVYYATLHINVPFTSVTALNPDTEVLSVVGNTVRLLCKDVHEVIIVATDPA